MANKKKNNKKHSTNNKKNITPKKVTTNKPKKVVQKKKEKVVDELLNNKEYKLAEKLYKEKKYKEAEDIYITLLEQYKKNRKIYKRLVECLTHDYTFKDKTKEFKNKYDDYVTTYRLLATKKDLKIFEERLEEYRSIRYSIGKSKFLLISLLGFTGIHKFLEKKYVLGIFYLLTLGFLGIGVIIDLINDYAEYEDDLQLNIIRYLISLLIIGFGILRNDTENYFCFIIIGILFTPIIYSKLLKYIPGIIKLAVIVVLVCFGFKTTPVINYIPTTAVGTWVTNNENTNFKELDIKLEETTIKFNDRDNQKGKNEYDIKNHLLIVKVNESKYYKFKLNLSENEICVYTESGKCVVGFIRKTK